MYKDRERDEQPVNISTREPAESLPSLAVVTAVGAEAGVEPSDLEPPLYEVVDPDALDTLFQDTTGTVSFEYHGSVVSVDHTNAVTLASTDDGDTHPTDSTSADDDPRAQRP